MTGASSGLGVAVAVAVAQAGADVVIGARRREMLEIDGGGRRRASAARALVVPTDVTLVEDCQRLVRRATETFGRLDGLVNNAGRRDGGPGIRSRLSSSAPCSTSISWGRTGRRRPPPLP